MSRVTAAFLVELFLQFNELDQSPENRIANWLLFRSANIGALCAALTTGGAFPSAGPCRIADLGMVLVTMQEGC